MNAQPNPARAAPWRAWVVTLFPDAFPGPLGLSLAGRALAQDLWALETVELRAHGEGRHRAVDDKAFGGGPGMVMRADVVAAAIDFAAAEAARLAGGAPVPLIYLSPRGAPFGQSRARALAAGPGAILVCGRYEGIDERVIEARGIEEVSLGDFVLSGGEPAALALIDSVVRLLPGVLGAAESLAEESFGGALLEYPHYTRPQTWEGRAVPKVLVSGDHRAIAAWRLAEAERITRERRPDVWSRYVESRAEAER